MTLQFLVELEDVVYERVEQFYFPFLYEKTSLPILLVLLSAILEDRLDEFIELLTLHILDDVNPHEIDNLPNGFVFVAALFPNEDHAFQSNDVLLKE